MPVDKITALECNPFCKIWAAQHTPLMFSCNDLFGFENTLFTPSLPLKFLLQLSPQTAIVLPVRWNFSKT
jgi:hypothetical protein